MKTVGIITRTKNRPLLLKRALSSVANQSFVDLVWVIVNDGGDVESVNEVVAQGRKQGLDIIVHHNSISQGMEAASNIGINLSQSKYVVIHDDDDSWRTDFLKKTVDFLERQPNSTKVKGVVTKSIKIVENIVNNEIFFKKEFPYNPSLSTMTLFEMAHFSSSIVPPPISFIYHRETLAEIGVYRADLKVLGDWEFYLRFLSKYDIGVIPEYLANYHWREIKEKNNYSNTVVAEIDVHAETIAYLKNDLLRKDLETGKLGIGFLVNIGDDFANLQNQLKPFLKIITALKKIREPIRRILPK